MRVLLLNSPWTHPFHPGINTASLTSFLRQQGIDTIQRDASVEAFNYFISKPSLARCVERLISRSNAGQLSREAVVAGLIKAENAIGHLDEVLRIFRSPSDYFVPDRLRFAQSILRQAFEVVSAAYSPLQWKDIYWEMPGVYQSSESIAAAAKSDAWNPFVDYYRELLLPSLEGAEFDLIGISISLDQMSQIVPGLAMARLLRETFPNTHICAGGVVFSKLEKRRDRFLPFFEFLDSIALFEGETALLRLAEAIDSKGNGAYLESIPNILTYRNGTVVSAPERHVEDIDRLPTPDLDGLPLDQYLSPHLIVPFAMSRGGCYYGKCTFCDTTVGQSGANRRRATADVIQDLTRLQKQTGAKRFLCVDEAIEVPRLKQFSRSLIDAGLNLTWSCWSRAIPTVDEECLDLMGQAGCTVITYGVDSGSDRVLRDMRKGTNRKVMTRIMKDTDAAGIAASVNVILGYPSETREDIVATIDFLFEVSDYVVKSNLLPFFFKSETPVYEMRDRYPINVHSQDNEDLIVFFSHQHHNGTSQEQVNRLCEEVEGALCTRKPVQKFVGEISQHPCGFLYFSEMGLEKVRAIAEHEAVGVSYESGQTADVTDPILPKIPALFIGTPSAALLNLLGEEASDRAVCFDSRNNRFYLIPQYMARILARCDGRTTVQEMAQELEEHLLIGPMGMELVAQTLNTFQLSVYDSKTV